MITEQKGDLPLAAAAAVLLPPLLLARFVGRVWARPPYRPVLLRSLPLLPVFVAASVATRGARFFIEAWVLKTWGPAMLAVVEKRLAMWGTIGIVVLVGAIVAVRFL